MLTPDEAIDVLDAVRCEIDDVDVDADDGGVGSACANCTIP